MSPYLIAQLNGGRYDDTQILSPEGIAALHRAAATWAAAAPNAMGWWTVSGIGRRSRVVAQRRHRGLPRDPALVLVGQHRNRWVHQVRQVTVAGDDRIGAGSESESQQVVVIGIAAPRVRVRGRVLNE